jgi:hypothetical protein
MFAASNSYCYGKRLHYFKTRGVLIDSGTNILYVGMLYQALFMSQYDIFFLFAGGIQSPVALWGWVAECIGSHHVLWIMLMAHPNQADRPQGSHHVSDGILAANDPGIGSGWQQSKQNWARPAVVGH